MSRTTLKEVKTERVIADEVYLGTNSSSLNYYEDYSFNSTLSGPFATAIATTVHITKIGKICTLAIEPTVGNRIAAAVIQLSENLPERFRPRVTGGYERVGFRVVVKNNSNDTSGSIYVGIDGSVIIANNINSTFQNNDTQCGFSDAIHVTYLTD